MEYLLLIQLNKSIKHDIVYILCITIYNKGYKAHKEMGRVS